MLVIPLLFALPAALSAQQEIWRTDGELREDLLGMSVAVVADADGDGLPDFLVGAPAASIQTSSSSLVSNLAGRASLRSGATGAVLREWVSDLGGDAFGGRVADVGDVDGDGTHDYGITAPRRPTSGFAPGALFIYSGADGSLLHALLNTSPTFAEYGTDVAGIGDVDGDGCADFVTSNFGFDFAPTNEAVSVVSGKTGATIRTHVGPLPGILDGLGLDLAAAGDVDADGVGDYVVSAPFVHLVPNENGVAYVYSGASGLLLLMLTDPVHMNGFGWGVCGAGDVDGDGHADLLVGNPGFAPSGQVLLHSGATGAVLATANGAPGASIGLVMSRTGDLDGDLVPDFAAAAGDASAVQFFSGATGALLLTIDAGPTWDASIDAGSDLTGDGATDLVVGKPAADASDQDGGAGRCVAFDLASGATIFDVHGTSFSSDCGRALAIVPDRDGDGHRDVAIGRPGGLGSNAGVVTIVSGASGVELARLSAGASRDRFGFALACVADVDGDGLDDLAIGAPGSPGGGAVELRSGADDALLATIAGPAGATSFGSTLASATDGSGARLLAIGDPDWRSGAAALGWVEVRDLIGGGVTMSASGSQPSARFGAALAAVGDVDGDGVIDWIAGAPDEDGSRADVGSVTLLSGSDATTIRKHVGPRDDAHLGSSVAGSADLDGDGIGDVLGGAPGVGIRSIGGTVTAWSGATGSVIATLATPRPDDEFGSAVASLGDVNRDGVDDLAIGSPASGTNGTMVGAVFLYSGATLRLLARLDGDTLYGGFGARLATIAWLADARVDPDPIPDLLASARIESATRRPIGRATLRRLDDLFLEVEPPNPPAGVTVTLTTRGGPKNQMAGLFVVAFDGVPVGRFIKVGSFDATGSWSVTDAVPPVASGHALTLRAYGVGFSGKLVDSQDVTVTIP